MNLKKQCKKLLTDYTYTLSIRESYTLLIIYHVGALENSIHIIFDTASKKCAIVDPAWESELFHTIIISCGYTLSQIWITHYHPDHVNGVDTLAKLTNATIYTGPTNEYLSIHSPFTELAENTHIKLGTTVAKIIYTPGHSSDGTCYLLTEDIFAGDALFVYGAGHCILPSADAYQMYTSLQKFKTEVPVETMLRCGHDYGSELTTTIGEQITGNPFLLIDNIEDFVLYRCNIHDTTRTYPMNAMTIEEVKGLLA